MTDVSDKPKVSLIVSTLGRDTTIVTLLESLRAQTFRHFDVVIVDQNDDDRLAEVLANRDYGFKLHHIRTPGERGLSRGRNRGWRASEGELILFPDDDCWYPAPFLERMVAIMEASGLDVLSGRAADENARSINGRYCSSKEVINRANVWTTQIEWVVMFRKHVLEKVGGYDENIGVGASSAWQSGEGQDIMLRVLAHGFTCVFDPTIFGHHAELNVAKPDLAMCKKGRAYGRGMGHVLRVHRFGSSEKIRWSLRPLAGAILYLPRNIMRSYYYLAVFIGRVEGIIGVAFK